MFLINKDKSAIVNMDQVTSIYTGADGCTLKADFGNGKGCQIGRYKSEKECRMAIQIISQSIGKAELCFSPQDDVISAKLNLTEGKKYHITGKKTKGHGGS